MTTTRRRARLRGHAAGKTVKLKVEEMSKFKFSPRAWPLLVAALIILCATLAATETNISSNQDDTTRMRRASARQSRKLGNNLHFHEASSLPANQDSLPDPMEPCYLANNRASETLTISESTPVGTIVGELMVNGDHNNSTKHGGIELAIVMPNAHDGPLPIRNDLAYADANDLSDGLGGSISRSGQQVKQSRDFHIRDGFGSHTRSNLSHTISDKDISLQHRRVTTREMNDKPMSRPKNARDLSYLIDLMPPLSIEQGTKRLILAKKLDRENLDKYMGSYQSSINTLSQSSSASLTVHIRCQLKESVPNINATNTTALGNSSSTTREGTSSSGQKKKQRKSSTNSILIPIHLIVTDENDNWPNFIGWPYIIDLNETAQVGSLLQGNEIVAVDNDQQGPLSTIEYSIVPGSFWSDSFGFLNPLDSRSLIVKDNRLFDYESQSKLTLKVMARDQGDPPNWAITSLYINLLDQDDLNPVFSEDKYFGLVKDNRPGEKIDVLPTRMVAHDGDRTISSPITYAFHMKTNHSIHFDLDSDLGQLTLKKTLPEAPHTKQAFCLLIKASQVDNAQRFTLAAINLKLAKYAPFRSGDASNSSSKESPKFSNTNYTVEISEAALVGSTILTASASHRRDEVVSYQLLDNESDYLAIDKTTGRITLNKSLDYEMFRQLTVRILATTERTHDDASESSSTTYPKLACDIARININVINYNDYTPEFSHEQYNFQLSISDLIANFEPSARMRLDADDESSLMARNGDKLNHRFGEIELDDAVDELEYKAIQLGQVYCADRDHGDKVSLKLAGSKAGLFHLSQDGRLYLPLVNVSSSSEPRRNAENTQETDGHQSKWGSKSSRIINNQFSMSRAFSARRSDSPQASGQLDRSYLNYLLGELSNLGRLRLKVHATDSGQPEARQSTALIVITIISIDNFIIQRGSSAIQYGDDATGATDTRGMSQEAIVSRAEPAASEHSSQVMMIPSMNGREFVHINSDIIGNLLATSKSFTPSARDDLNQKSSSLPDNLDSSASNTITSSLRPNDRIHSTPNKHHPPGLLLVDNEGAKFVAMPAAIEVYNQQVQDAAGQQARQKLRLDRRELEGSAGGIWSTWTSKLGFPAPIGDNWTSVTATVLLHIVIILAIIGLATRIRSYVTPRAAGNHGGPGGFDPADSESSHGRWPRRISNLGSFFVPKSGVSDSASDILNHHQSSASIYGNVPSNHRIDHHQYSSYHDHMGAPDDSGISNADDNSRRRQQVVSSGPVVSAMSNGIRHSPRVQQASNCDETEPPDVSPEARNQQNLFDHLKLTLNRMMDNSETSGEPLVSMRPLDSDVVAFEDQRDRQLDDRAQCRETSELQLHQQQQPSQKHGKKLPEERTAISTFVGSQTSQRSPTQVASATVEPTHDNLMARRAGKATSSTVVSINVVAPPSDRIRHSPRGDQESARIINNKSKHQNSSSSSSVVSLGGLSAASSLSNKISEAVGRASGGDQVTGSDASSLNSSILLQSRIGSSSSSVNEGKSTPASDFTRRNNQSTSKPPAPPPLPPPPSQIRAARTRDSSSGYSESPPSMSPKYVNSGQLCDADSHHPAPSSHRQAIPENPIYSKLKRETIPSVQPNDRVRSSPGGSRPSITKACQNPNPTPSVVGRREARNHMANNPTRVWPPSPPPMPSSGLSGGKKLTTTNKTVSPTTSVDRGYESFQSYDQSRMVSHAGSRQFSSLQDYEPATCAGTSCSQQYIVASLPAYDTNDVNQKNSRSTTSILETRGRRVSGDKSVTYRTNSNKTVNPIQTLRTSQPSGRRVRTSSERGRRTLGNTTTLKTDCDTEDDDFYYCCSDLAHADSTHHQLPPSGGLLSDYASHTYKQPVSTPSSSQAAKSKRSLGDRWVTTNITKGTVDASNFSNDLIPYPCEYQHQQGNPVDDMSQVCDMSPQYKRAPAQYQYGSDGGGQRRIALQQQQMTTLSHERHANGTPRQKRAAGPHPSQSVMNDSYLPAGQSKKQLTWSDQVEMDPY